MNRLTKEFYEQDARAAALRNICLSVVMAAEELTDTGDANSPALGVIMDGNRQLSELGITPEMHALDPTDPDRETRRQQIASSPVIAAEWISGQVVAGILATGGFTTTNEDSHALIAEHNITPDIQHGLFDMTTAPQALKDYMLSLMVIGSLKHHLDYRAGFSDLQ